jgi:hypothetical protein
MHSALFMNSLGSSLAFSRTTKAMPSHTMGRRVEPLRLDPGLRLLLHAKAHLWTDLLNRGTENEGAIEFLSEFILFFAKPEQLSRA